MFATEVVSVTSCRTIAGAWVWVSAVLLFAANVRGAAPESELLLPDTTKLYVRAASLDRLLTNFDKSHLGRFWNGAEMKEFVQHLRVLPQMFWTRAERNAGTTCDELRQLAAGEASLATVVFTKDRSASIFLAHVDGRESGARELVTTAIKRLVGRGATHAQRALAGTTVDVVSLRPEKGERRQTVFFVRDGVLGISGDVELAELVLSRWGKPEGSLSRLGAYRDIMDRCAARAQGAVPDLCWYCDPVQLVTWMRTREVDDEEEVGESARRHGFDGIRGVGGFADFDSGGLVRHRTVIHAPPPFRSSLRMLSFPSGGDSQPADWVPSDVSSYLSLSIDVGNVLEHCAAAYDDMIASGAQGTFDGLLKDLRAADGPGVDVKSDLVAHLQDRMELIGRPTVPVSETSEGSVAVFRTRDEPKVAAAVERLMQDDPGATRIRLRGHEQALWKIGEDAEAELAEGPLKLISSGIMVTRGCLLFANNYESIRSLLTSPAAGTPLSGSPAFRRLNEELAGYRADDVIVRTFSHTDRDLMTSYELLRLGKAEDAEAKYVRWIEGLLAAACGGDSGDVAFEKLPKFERVRHSLGTSGMVGSSHENGWLLEGVLVPPEP